MYVSFYGMTRRPFSATPDANCFAAAETFQTTLKSLVEGIEQGYEISLLTAAAGAGKTLLCERLILELGDGFTSIFLKQGNTPNRTSLLQTLLYELGREYADKSDQELRLEFTTAVKESWHNGQPIVIVVDEAHTLSEELIEEIRTLGNHSADGTSLVRIVFSGQLQFEEKLASPKLEAVNQRIRAHLLLDSLSTKESIEYIVHRLQWAGGNVSEIFDDEAIHFICQVSDGVPRCLNQLCDHSLLLGFVSESKPIGVDVVKDAMDDVRQLPLQWNEPSISVDDPIVDATTDESPESVEAVELETNEELDEGVSAEENVESLHYTVPGESVVSESDAQIEAVEFGVEEVGSTDDTQVVVCFETGSSDVSSSADESDVNPEHSQIVSKSELKGQSGSFNDTIEMKVSKMIEVVEATTPTAQPSSGGISFNIGSPRSDSAASDVSAAEEPQQMPDVDAPGDDDWEEIPFTDAAPEAPADDVPVYVKADGRESVDAPTPEPTPSTHDDEWEEIPFTDSAPETIVASTSETGTITGFGSGGFDEAIIVDSYVRSENGSTVNWQGNEIVLDASRDTEAEASLDDDDLNLPMLQVESSDENSESISEVAACDIADVNDNEDVNTIASDQSQDVSTGLDVILPEHAELADEVVPTEAAETAEPTDWQVVANSPENDSDDAEFLEAQVITPDFGQRLEPVEEPADELSDADTDIVPFVSNAETEESDTRHLDIESRLLEETALERGESDDDESIEGRIGSDVLEMLFQTQQELMNNTDRSQSNNLQQQLEDTAAAISSMPLDGSEDEVGFDVIMPEQEAAGSNVNEPAIPVGAPQQPQGATPSARPYGRLFTRLRRQIED